VSTLNISSSEGFFGAGIGAGVGAGVSVAASVGSGVGFVSSAALGVSVAASATGSLFGSPSGVLLVPKILSTKFESLLIVVNYQKEVQPQGGYTSSIVYNSELNLK
jgi:hypothetical protein